MWQRGHALLQSEKSPALYHREMEKFFTMFSSSHRESSWMRFNSAVINVLTPVFLLAALSASAVAFFYPLEIETRESTVWLHVLALRHGINIYDYSQVAFIHMYAGPADSLFKLLVTRVFPFLEPWQVTRFAVFILPYLFLIVSWKLILKFSTGSLLHALYLGSIGYLFLVISAREFLFVGRFDATAALFFLLFTYISIAFSPKTDWMAALHGFVCGVSGMLAMLTNWRMVPAVVALIIFTLWMYRNAYDTAVRQILIYLLSAVAASLALWGLIIFYQFDGDLRLYWVNFFGLFSKASGHGHRPYAHASAIWFLGSLFKPIVSPDSLKGGPLLWALIVYLLIPRKREAGNKMWFALNGFVFAVCALAYYLNYYGGGQWYFIPFAITLWLFFCVNYPVMPMSRLAALGGLMAALLCINFNTVITPSLWRVSTMRQAYDFMDNVRSLQKTNSILSEDTFFFRTSYQGELIDMGDTVSRVRKSGYYGDEFNRTVDYYFERTKKHPPDYIVTGFTESPELRRFIAEDYILLAQGPKNFTANGLGESRLFKRKNLAVQ